MKNLIKIEKLFIGVLLSCINQISAHESMGVLWGFSLVPV